MLFYAAGPLVPGNGGADMVPAYSLACGGNFLLRFAGCQGKDPVIDPPRVTRLDFGREAANGIATTLPPREGEAYPHFVPSVDPDGNARRSVAVGAIVAIGHGSLVVVAERILSQSSRRPLASWAGLRRTWH